MSNSIKKVMELVERKDKKKFLILFFMMILAAFFETIGIGLIVPFVGIITDPNQIQESVFLSNIYDSLNFKSDHSFIIFSVGVLLIVFILKNIYLLLFQYSQLRVILNQQVKLSSNLFKEYLTKSYTFHLQRNTADLLRNVNEEVSKMFQGVIMSTFQLLTEFLVIICILTLLLITSPVATITAFILLGGSVYIFFKFFKKKISQLGKEQQDVSGSMIKWVNQGLGASKVVKVSGRESFFINAYKGKSQIKANNSRYIKMLEQVPRLFIETLLVSVVLMTMVIILIQGKNTSELIATMALFAMAAFRLMPSITRVVAMLTSIKYNQPALDVVYNDLILNKGSEVALNPPNKTGNVNADDKIFNDSISMKSVWYKYPGQDVYSIKDVSLDIPIGKSVAFIGASGAGKTTVVDIILGLYEPEEGKVTVDGKQLSYQKDLWQKKIGYIPQSIYLSDDSIKANVAFGIQEEEISNDDVWRALEQAQLKDFVKGLPEKLDTKIGENGVRLSGGQRQRIGIARALYTNPEILFMDEATSALDNETEKEIMAAIDGLKGEKTLIIIAHRLSTIENCDVVYKMSKGKLIDIENKTLKKSIM